MRDVRKHDVWCSIQHLEGELVSAPKQDKELSSCCVIHACLGGKWEFAGTSVPAAPFYQGTVPAHTSQSRQDSFTGWVHEVRISKPGPYTLNPGDICTIIHEELLLWYLAQSSNLRQQMVNREAYSTPWRT